MPSFYPEKFDVYSFIVVVQNKLTALKEGNDMGELDRDQKEAITKIKDVSLQLELIRDLQKQFSQVEAEVSSN